MAKLTLGNRPKTFETTASIPLVDGTTAKVRCTFKNFTRSEYAAMMDEHVQTLTARMQALQDAAKRGTPAQAPLAATKPRATPEAAAEASPAMPDALDTPGFARALLQAQTDADADLALRLLEGWGLDEPLKKETLLQLFDEIGGAAAHLFDAARAGIVEGRLGN